MLRIEVDGKKVRMEATDGDIRRVADELLMAVHACYRTFLERDPVKGEYLRAAVMMRADDDKYWGQTPKTVAMAVEVDRPEDLWEEGEIP